MDAVSLERVWIKYQQQVATLRNVVPGLLTEAFHGRQQHTFVIGRDVPPDHLIPRLIMRPTPGEPNGIPDLAPSTYVGRLVSVSCAGVVLMMVNALVQALARELGLEDGFRFEVGSKIAERGQIGAKASVALYAGANHFRHIDEWAEDAVYWGNPKDEDQRKRHVTQRRSMEVISAVLGERLPIKTNLCYELISAFFGEERHYREFEAHLLMIGKHALIRAGMPTPVMGVTVIEMRPLSEVETSGESYIVMPGVLRAAD